MGRCICSLILCVEHFKAKLQLLLPSTPTGRRCTQPSLFCLVYSCKHKCLHPPSQQSVWHCFRARYTGAAMKQQLRVPRDRQMPGGGSDPMSCGLCQLGTESAGREFQRWEEVGHNGEEEVERKTVQMPGDISPHVQKETTTRKMSHLYPPPTPPPPRQE